MRKVYVELKVRLIIQQNNYTSTTKVINELDYHFKDTTGIAEIVDSEILDFEVVDSK